MNKDRTKIVLHTKRQILDAIKLKMSNESFESVIEDVIEEALNTHDVGSTFAIEFAQYTAKEHYVLVNQIGKIHYWKNETSLRTSEQLLSQFKINKE